MVKKKKTEQNEQEIKIRMESPLVGTPQVTGLVKQLRQDNGAKLLEQLEHSEKCI